MGRFGPVASGAEDADAAAAATAAEAWAPHARALLAWLPLLPVVGVATAHPASGVLSDSFAAADGAGWQLVAVWAFAAAALAEYLLLDDRSAWLLLVVPCYAAVVLTTLGQDLLAATNACDGWCVLHLFALLLYCGAELAGLRARGYGYGALAPYALALLVLAVWYRTVLDASGFDAADPDTLQRLRLVGALEIGAFAIGRALVAVAA